MTTVGPGWALAAVSPKEGWGARTVLPRTAPHQKGAEASGAPRERPSGWQRPWASRADLKFLEKLGGPGQWGEEEARDRAGSPRVWGEALVGSEENGYPLAAQTAVKSLP